MIYIIIYYNMWIICMQQQHNIMLTSCSHFWWPIWGPLGVKSQACNLKEANSLEFTWSVCPLTAATRQEKKQVDIDGLKPTVSSRKKEGSIWKHFTIFTIVFWLRSYGCVINHWTRRWDPCRGSFWEFEMSMHRICSSEDWAILSHCSSSELLFCLHIWMTCTGSAVDKLVLRPLLPIG